MFRLGRHDQICFSCKMMEVISAEEKSGEGAGEYIRVHFRVKCPIRLGQSLAISGSSFSLGNFNASKVFKLYTTPEAYPIWFTNVDTPVLIHKKEILNDEGVRYNYCLLEGGVVKAFERSHADPLTQAQDAVVRLLNLGNTAGNDVVIEDESLLYRQHYATDHNSDIDIFEHVRQLSSSQSKQHITIPTSFSNMSLTSKVQQKKEADAVPLKLFIVCYHLPVTITINKSDTTANGEYRPFEITWAESLIAKSENSVASAMLTTWIGTISVGKDISAPEKQWLVETLAAMNCIAVFLEKDIARDSYKGFCKTVMWPVFHNVDQLDHIHAAWNLHPESAGNVLHTSKEKSSCKDHISGTLNPSSENFKAETNLQNDKVVEWNKMGMQYFQSYKTMNEAFATALFPHIDSSCENIVWVHDYHLMLLPSALRKPPCEFGGLGTVPIKMKIIYFMHIPFPTSQIFRTVPMSTTFLQSMVCADLVGFHAFDHARHFLNATKRLLGIKSYTRTGGMLTLLVQDREVVVTMNHVSIEPDLIEKALRDPDTQRMAAEWKAKYHGKKIIAGVDICQRLSGGALKMAAFEKLLVDYNLGEKGAVVLIQRCIRSGSREQDEQTTSTDMHKMVNEINGKFSSKANLTQSDKGDEITVGGKSLVDYEEVSGMTLNQRVALWLAADVFLLTPIREGLNLMPLEYIYARKDLPSAGAVVVSEFSTCSSLLNGSLKVNPFAALHVADALEKALSMSMKDMNYRRQRDLLFVSSHPSSLWTRNILRDLDLDSSSPLPSSNNHLSTNISKSKSIKKYPEPLSVDQVVTAYDNALRTTGLCKTASRVFIFDYGGTLLHKEKYDIEVKKTMSAISGRKPTDKVMEAIRKLSDDPNNVVMVVTGLTKLKMGDTFSDMPNVTLITSIGLVYRWGLNLKSSGASVTLSADSADSGEEKSSSAKGYRAYATKDPPTPQEQAHHRWEFLNNTTDWAAVSDIAMPIITRFTFRTNGTCQTPRIPGIGWSYFGSDPDWGEKQASQLKVELEAALAKFDVKVASLIQGSIEVVPSNLHKGVMVEALLKRVLAKRANKLPSFVLIVGDEESDDHMFKAFYNVLGSSSPNSGIEVMRAFTVTVAKRESPAHYYINSVQDVEHLVHVLGVSSSTESPSLERVVDDVVVDY